MRFCEIPPDFTLQLYYSTGDIDETGEGRTAAARSEMVVKMILPTLRLVRQPHLTIRSVRHFSSSTSTKSQPKIPTRPPAAIRQRSKDATPIRTRQSIPYSRSRADLARQLYYKGVREIYSAPSHLGWTILSWTIGSVLIGGTINLWWIKNWDSDNIRGMGAWQKMFVTSANRISMFFMTALGGFAVLRYSGFIRSIRLVEISRYNIGMQIHIRRRTPFSKTLFTVPPGDIVMPRDWRQSLARTDSQSTSRSVAGFLVTPFKAFKDFILMTGVVAPVRFNENNSRGMMDPVGIKVSAAEYDSLTRESVE